MPASIEVIMEKLNSMDHRLSGIETAVTAIAVQDNKIINIQKQLNALWDKYDASFSQNGVISKMKDHQANCPKYQLKYLWAALAFTAGIFGTTLFVVIK